MRDPSPVRGAISRMITSSHEGCRGQVIFCSCVDVQLISSRFLPRLAVSHGGGEADRVAQPPPWQFQDSGQTERFSRLHDSDGSSRHATTHAVADTAHRADQINVQSRACRQTTVQSASLLSPRQPEPFLTCGLDTAEPHIRSPLIAAAPKFLILEVIGLGKSGTNLYHGILQPGRYAVRSPRSGKGQLPSRMAGFSFDVARWDQDAFNTAPSGTSPSVT